MDITPEQLAWIAIIAGVLAVAAQLKWVKALGGRNRDKARYGFGAVCLICLYMGGFAVISGWASPGTAPVNPNVPVVTPTACGVACPTSGVTVVTWDYQNVLDSSAATTFDVTALCTSDAGVITQSDTTGGTGNYNCGKAYTCKVLSTSGDAGDSSTVKSILAGSGATVTADGDLKFTACSAAQSLLIGGMKHGVPKARVWNINSASWLKDAANSTDYSATDGAVFGVDDATPITVGANGKLNVRADISAVTAYTGLNDRGILILVKAPIAEWDSTQSTFSINGEGVSCQKSANLNADEQNAYDTYQYACKYTGTDIVGNNQDLSFEMHLMATGGANPSTDVEVDIAMIGQYAATTNSQLYKVGAVKDDSSKTQVYGLHDMNINIA